MTKPQDSEARFICTCFMVGIGLSGIAWVAPDAGPGAGSFFKIATQTSWGRLFEIQPAWCSLKIILLALGLILVLNAVGFMFVNPQRNKLAALILSSQALLLVGLMVGFFFLFKALL
jgi:hypothetical protein